MNAARKILWLWLVLSMVSIMALVIFRARRPAQTDHIASGTIVRIAQTGYGGSEYVYSDDGLQMVSANSSSNSLTKKDSKNFGTIRAETNSLVLLLTFSKPIGKFDLQLLPLGDASEKWEEAPLDGGRHSQWEPILADSSIHYVEINHFPRSEKLLRFEIQELDSKNFKKTGELRLPNPACKVQPKWNARVLPISTRHGEYEFTLTEFYNGHVKPDTNFWDSLCSARVDETRKGAPMMGWMIQSMEVEDGTGNSWKGGSQWYGPNWWRHDGHYILPASKAYKLRFSVCPLMEFSTANLWTIHHIPLPPPHATTFTTDISWDREDFTLRLRGLSGELGSFPEGSAQGSNPMAHFEMIPKTAKVSTNWFITVVDILNDQGTSMLKDSSVEVVPFVEVAEIKEKFALQLKCRTETKYLDLLLGISQPKQIEFIAKPILRPFIATE